MSNQAWKPAFLELGQKLEGPLMSLPQKPPAGAGCQTQECSMQPVSVRMQLQSGLLVTSSSHCASGLPWLRMYDARLRTQISDRLVCSGWQGSLHA